MMKLTHNRKLNKIVKSVNSYAETMKSLSDEQLKDKTEVFRSHLANGESLDNLLPEAFAVVREADKRVLGLYPFDEQVLGGIILAQGNLAEMKTGEGKTLTETMPVYLNAITGKGVHVVTVNDYLSHRDSTEMGKVFKWLGLSVGYNTSQLDFKEKQRAYAADITYSTNDELAFDYLRDNMILYPKMKVQRELNYAIIDEVDSILIDEARTPLIISGKGNSYVSSYQSADSFVKRLDKDDYILSEETKTVSLTNQGIKKANEFFGLSDLYDADNLVLAHFVDNALKANYAMYKNVDYIVKDNEAYIVDSFTGRVMEGRRYADGLHQAIEAKEQLPIHEVNRTNASITYQNYFRMYHKISGMTGTAMSDAKEFNDNYHMEVISVPTHKPVIRKDLPDVIYPTSYGRDLAVLRLVEKLYSKKQPVLIGTISVNSSERFDELLTHHNIPHTVLNAKNNQKEAEIIAKAGQKCAVTIATNMAGRGTDIKLGMGVASIGGLFVIGTEKHDATRIDNQLRGRSGRQGDPGSTKFFLSLEDDIVKRYGSEQIDKVRQKLIKKRRGNLPIRKRSIARLMNEIQKKVEGNNYDERRDTLRYDDVLRLERNVVYQQRDIILNEKGNIDDYIVTMIAQTINKKVNEFYRKKRLDFLSLQRFCSNSLSIDLSREEIKGMNKNKIKRLLLNRAVKHLLINEKHLNNKTQLLEFERVIVLKAIDECWEDNINQMDQLRLSISLRGYAQHNPLIEYQNTAHLLYQEMISDIESKVTKDLLNAEIVEGVKN